MLDDPLNRLEWDAPGIADDEMPWQAGSLVGAGDVEIFGRPPRWRRIGPRGVAAIVATVMLAGLAGLQITGNLPGGGGAAEPSATADPTATTGVLPSPTTAPPTTAAPTTAAPATLAPTTAVPTTALPSTTVPTTPPSTRPAAVQPPTTIRSTTLATAAPTTATPPPSPSTGLSANSASPANPAAAVQSSTPAASTAGSSTTVQPQTAATPSTQGRAAPLLPVAGPVTGQPETGQPTAAAQAGTAPAGSDAAAAAPAAAATPGADTATAAPSDTATPASTDTAQAGSTDPGAAGAITSPSGQPIHATANTNVGAATTNNSSTPANVFEPLRNNQAKFSQFAGVPSNQLDMGALTVATDRPDNGGQDVEGQFRILCEYSHLSYDDPIVFPGQPGRSHLHMFFGNTNTDAFTTADSLVNSGGGTCNGFELNRSAYWFPAMLKGEEAVIAPHSIVVYYKTKNPGNAVAPPQGLKLVAGNPRAETFEPSQRLHWSCGPSGGEYNVSNHIPNCGTDFVNAVLQFPNCWDGTNLDSADHASHVTFALDDLGSCPASHPTPIPQISILLYWQGTGSVDGWHLSSDNYNGFNTSPGSTLHADWFGGWNEQAMQTWMNGCIKAVRNCSGGQTGTDRVLAPVNGMQIFEGDPVLPLPAGSYQMG